MLIFLSINQSFIKNLPQNFIAKKSYTDNIPDIFKKKVK